MNKVVVTREKARISGAFPAKVDNTPPPQAKYTILFDPKPPYNYNAVNEDWGVTRLHPSLAWAKE